MSAGFFAQWLTVQKEQAPQEKMLVDKPVFRGQMPPTRTTSKAILWTLGVGAIVNLIMIAANRGFHSVPDGITAGLIAAIAANLVAATMRSTWPHADYRQLIQLVISGGTILLFFAFLKFLAEGALGISPEGVFVSNYVPQVIVFIALFAVGPHLVMGRTAWHSLSWALMLAGVLGVLHLASWVGSGWTNGHCLAVFVLGNLPLAWLIGHYYRGYYLANPGLSLQQMARGWTCPGAGLVVFLIIVPGLLGILICLLSPFPEISADKHRIITSFEEFLFLVLGPVLLTAFTLFGPLLVFCSILSAPGSFIDDIRSHFLWFGYEHVVDSPATFRFQGRLGSPTTRQWLYLGTLLFNIGIMRVVFAQTDYRFDGQFWRRPFYIAITVFLPLLMPFILTVVLHCISFACLRWETARKEGDE